MSNPCLSCGACCAHFRVSFFWGECTCAGGIVPENKVTAISPTYVAMQGTLSSPTRCVALLGNIGDAVRCTMYEQRSSSCREFSAAWEKNEPNIRCDKARAAHGLAPIEPPLAPNAAPDAA